MPMHDWILGLAQSAQSNRSKSLKFSGVDSGGAEGARAPLEFVDSEKGRKLISAYRSLAITASTFGFEKLSTALKCAYLISIQIASKHLVITILLPGLCFLITSDMGFLYRFT